MVHAAGLEKHQANRTWLDPDAPLAGLTNGGQ